MTKLPPPPSTDIATILADALSKAMIGPLTALVVAEVAKALVLHPSLHPAPHPLPRGLEEPMSMLAVDRKYKLRKGTAKRAWAAGYLKGTARKGRGGSQVWTMPSDAHAWFTSGANAGY